MSYRYDKQKKQQRLWYGIASLILLLALFTPVYSVLYGSIQNAAIGAWENNNNFSADTKNFFQAFAAKQTILESNNELQRKIDRLEVDNLRTRYLSDQLEETLGLNQDDTVVASILDYGSLSSYDHIVINRGETDGVSIGDSVLMADQVLIGYVSEVFSKTSRVTLYSDNNQSVIGVLYPHNETLTATGAGGSTFIIDSPREIDVAVGDVFYALAQPGNIIAVVSSIDFDPRDPFKKVYLSYPINLKQHNLVAVKKTLTQSE